MNQPSTSTSRSHATIIQSEEKKVPFLTQMTAVRALRPGNAVICQVFTCRICTRILRKPVMLKACLCRFCIGCIDHHLRFGITRCPNPQCQKQNVANKKSAECPYVEDLRMEHAIEEMKLHSDQDLQKELDRRRRAGKHHPVVLDPMGCEPPPDLGVYKETSTTACISDHIVDDPEFRNKFHITRENHATQPVSSIFALERQVREGNPSGRTALGLRRLKTLKPTHKYSAAEKEIDTTEAEEYELSSFPTSADVKPEPDSRASTPLQDYQTPITRPTHLRNHIKPIQLVPDLSVLSHYVTKDLLNRMGQIYMYAPEDSTVNSLRRVVFERLCSLCKNFLTPTELSSFINVRLLPASCDVSAMSLVVLKREQTPPGPPPKIRHAIAMNIDAKDKVQVICTKYPNKALMDNVTVEQINDLHLNNKAKPLRLVYQLIEIHRKTSQDGSGESGPTRTVGSNKEYGCGGTPVKSEHSLNGSAIDLTLPITTSKSPLIKTESPAKTPNAEQVKETSPDETFLYVPSGTDDCRVLYDTNIYTSIQWMVIDMLDENDDEAINEHEVEMKAEPSASDAVVVKFTPVEMSPFKIPSLPKKIFDRIRAEEKPVMKQKGIRLKKARVNARKILSAQIPARAREENAHPLWASVSGQNKRTVCATLAKEAQPPFKAPRTPPKKNNKGNQQRRNPSSSARTSKKEYGNSTIIVKQELEEEQTDDVLVQVKEEPVPIIEVFREEDLEDSQTLMKEGTEAVCREVKQENSSPDDSPCPSTIAPGRRILRARLSFTPEATMPTRVQPVRRRTTAYPGRFSPSPVDDGRRSRRGSPSYLRAASEIPDSKTSIGKRIPSSPLVTGALFKRPRGF